MLSLFIPLGILILSGLTALSSVSAHSFHLQLIWVAMACLLIFVFTVIDWRSVFNHPILIWGFYGGALFLILMAYFFSPLIRNAHSWIVVGPITIQPVEFMKIALIFLYANYFRRRHLAVARLQTILVSFVFFVVPAMVAVRLPDLGSAVIFFAIWFGFLVLLGLPPNRLFVAIGIFLIASIFLWMFVLRDYHRARIIGFLYPQQHSLGINYSSAQARIAIGSAGLFGKGYGQGTQTQLGFLSEPTEDFIFPAIIEEWGVVGGLLVVGALVALMYEILRIGVLADENFEKFICLGTAMMLGVQFLLNAGSASGLLPVVGVTFPFVSYGGSSMVVDAMLIAVVNSIRRRS